MFGFLKKLFGKKKTLKEKISKSLFDGELQKAFKNKIDQDFLNDLEESLLKADIGVRYTEKLVNSLASGDFEGDITYDQIKNHIRAQIKEELSGSEAKLSLDKKPYVILASGVNGSGKTTTLGKLANKLAGEGKKVVVAAADTFRAAAVGQLDVWAKRAGVKLITAEKEGGDPAALAYQALEFAQKEGYDVVLIDTAGRLQNNKNFMDQLGKIVRVLKKLDESAPHLSLLVLDGTTGQNALRQLEGFKEQSMVNGIIMTKLDGTAKGGAIIPIVKEFEVPVYFVGMGEGIDDLYEFNLDEYIKKLI